MFNNAMGLILADNKKISLGELSNPRALSAMPFGGRYRIIDFMLSNMVNSGISTVGLITPYKYRSVIDHIGAGKDWQLDRKNGGLFILPGTVYGGHNTNNGSESRSVKGNLTFTTNIPQVRMIISLKLEGNLFTYSRTLSQRADGSARSYVLADKTDPLSFIEGKSIYDEEGYTVFFPETYSSFDDPNTQIPFLEKFRWAKENDPVLYTDLSNLIITNTSENYTYMKDFMSPSFNAHFSVTKEISDIASISFYANNFINMQNRVYSSRTKSWLTMNPAVYYGLTLRLFF